MAVIRQESPNSSTLAAGQQFLRLLDDFCRLQMLLMDEAACLRTRVRDLEAADAHPGQDAGQEPEPMDAEGSQP